MSKRKKIKTINSLSEIPGFISEGEERKFWETHDISNKLAEKLYEPKANKEFSRIQKKLKMTDRRK